MTENMTPAFTDARSCRDVADTLVKAMAEGGDPVALLDALAPQSTDLRMSGIRTELSKATGTSWFCLTSGPHYFTLFTGGAILQGALFVTFMEVHPAFLSLDAPKANDAYGYFDGLANLAAVARAMIDQGLVSRATTLTALKIGKLIGDPA